MRGLDISTDVIHLPVPEMFASADEKVISWKGRNFYQACGEDVQEHYNIDTNLVDGMTTCVKPIGHATREHEDADGRFRIYFGEVTDMDMQIRSEVRQLLRSTGIEEHEVFNVLNAIIFGGYSISRNKGARR